MKKLNTCQCLIALGVHAMANDNRLAELNADESSLASIGNEFYDGETAADLEGDIRIIDVDGRGFALVAEDDVDEDGEPNDGVVGLLIETKADEPGLFMHDQIYSGGDWVDAEE